MKFDAVLVLCFVASVGLGWACYRMGYRQAQFEIGDRFWRHCMFDSFWGPDGPNPGVCGWDFEKALGFQDLRDR